nr:MAG TPA: hypothetical protein [Caudoviricetes sp.]
MRTGYTSTKASFQFHTLLPLETVKPNKKTPVLLLILWLVFFYTQIM